MSRSKPLSIFIMLFIISAAFYAYGMAPRFNVEPEVVAFAGAPPAAIAASQPESWEFVSDVETVGEGETAASQVGPAPLQSVLMRPLENSPKVELATEAFAVPAAVNPSTIAWIDYFNLFRAEAKVPLVSEYFELTNGSERHSTYLVKNDETRHFEDDGNNLYSDEGFSAAKNGNLYITIWEGASHLTALDFWMSAPFHALPILNPKLQYTGYNQYFEKVGQHHFGATLDIKSKRLEEVPEEVEFPILFPGRDGRTWVTRFTLFEYPNPLASCPGYARPTGAPILIQMGAGDVTPNVTSYRLSSGGETLQACMFNETNYANETRHALENGRWILGNQDAIVIIPRNPLEVGKRYDVEVVVNGETISWGFDVVTLDEALQTVPGAIDVNVGSEDGAEAEGGVLPPINLEAAEPEVSTVTNLPWLDYVNFYRDRVGLPAVTENGDLSIGAKAHSQYLVKEDDSRHAENEDSEWYSEEGARTARIANLYIDWWKGANFRHAIDFWMSAPFHATPAAQSASERGRFWYVREEIGKFHYGATMDVKSAPLADTSDVEYPIMFPPRDGETWALKFFLYEYPEPLASCGGYTIPTGPPIILQIGDGSLTPDVTEFSFSTEGRQLTACLFDETSYNNPRDFAQAEGRHILGKQDAIVIMPRDPLEAGRTYSVRVVVNGETIEWDFKAVNPPSR